MSIRILCSLAFIFASAAQSPVEEEHAIHALEAQIEAATNSNDGDALGNLWAPDYLFVNPAGQRLTRDDRVRTFRTGSMRLESYTRDQESIRLYATSAVVFFRSTVSGARGGTDISSQRRVTMVVVKRDGRWQAVSQQSSRIAPSAAAAVVPAAIELRRPDVPSAAQDAEQQVRRAEQEIAAATEKSDANALEHLWAPEFVWIGPSGLVLTRADRLGAMRSGSEKSQQYSIDQETIHVFGATAVATFRSTIAGGIINGKDVSSQRMVTNVLVRSDGRWQAVSQHSTIIETR